MLCDLSYMWKLDKNKKATLINTDWRLPEAGVGVGGGVGGAKKGKGSKKAQTCSYKIGKSWGGNYSMVAIVNAVLCI